MAKILVIQCLWYVWEIDAGSIAHHRAMYYANKEEPPDKDAVYQEEYDFTLNDNDELWDWYHNNVSWDEIPLSRKRYRTQPRILSPDQLNEALLHSEWTFTIEEREER